MIGYLTRLLPIRVAVSGAAPVSQFLESTRETLLQAFEHRDYTLTELLRKLNPVRIPGRTPLVDVVFNYDRAIEAFQFTGLDARLESLPLTAAKYDLDFNVLDTKRGLLAEVEYNADLFLPGSGPTRSLSSCQPEPTNRHRQSR